MHISHLCAIGLFPSRETLFERVIATYALSTKTDVSVGALMYREIEQKTENHQLWLFFANTLTKYMTEFEDFEGTW